MLIVGLTQFITRMQMETGYFVRLPADLQAFVTLIESETGIEIEVEVDDSRVGRHVGEPDPLACVVNEAEARILIPSGDYFPDGSVLHELLHIHRFLVDGVPQIAVCEEYLFPELEKVFTQLDNNLEHLVIVPEELRRRPGRRDRWVTVMQRVLDQIRSGELANADRDFLALYSSVFIPHVLAHSDLSQQAQAALASVNLMDRAAQFCDNILPALSSKEAMTRACVEQFCLSGQYLCFNYFDPRQGNCRHAHLS